MTPDIAMVLVILVAAIIMFVTERIRVDVVALMVLVSLVLTNLITPAEALSGFANLAVVTVWAVLILSNGLARTGVAALIGRPVLRLAGDSEAKLIALIMLVVGVLSGFMNDIGVAALMLPVVVDIARRTGRPPSRLLMPLAFAALLGGLNTLIGTPPNILVSEALRQYGLEPFHMFDYTPTGVVVMLSGIAFMVLVGRHLLPSRDIKELSEQDLVAPGEFFGLQERLFVVRLPHDSALADKTLAQSRLGAALGLNVLAILRPDQNRLAPGPAAILRPGDRLLVEGRPDRLAELRGRRALVVQDNHLAAERLLSAEIDLAELALTPQSSLPGRTLEQIDFRRRFGVVVLAIRRGGGVVRTNLEKLPLQRDDILLVQGTRERLDLLRAESEFALSSIGTAEGYRLEERLLTMRVPEGSSLVNKTLVESRLGDAFGLGVMGIVREGGTQLMPDAEERLAAGDLLLVKSRPDDLVTLEGLQSLEPNGEAPPDLAQLESEHVGLVEVVLSPRTTLAGNTLRQIHFREKYGLSVLAIWREGRAHRSDLRDMALRFGDALLLYGPREKLRVLGLEPDFLVLTEAAVEAPRLNKAPIALLIMAIVLIPVILDLLPIAIAALAGVVLMILAQCLTMEEAYRAIEWKAVFLIAGMLPLGIAMEQTGAASFLAEGMVGLVGPLGPLAVMAGLFILAALASQVMPNPAVAVLLAPIALNTAGDMGVSPYPFMMAVAVSASAAFLSPVGHSANVLVMGPGGYRFADYTKVGIPLTLVVLLIVALVVPIFWPF
ncbi:MAG TPA: SLC13 family permease [Anaerolineae bacterium]|nr:SLC13 family permease [Anaerolineae bacterium]